MAASLPGVRRVCTVCCQQVAQYTCPRCHKAYCSSSCYKKHGQQCTESFYREQATSQMKATVADRQQQQQMMAILQRLHEQGQLGSLDNDNSSSSSIAVDSSEEEEEEDSGPAAALRQMPALKQLVRKAAKQGDSFDLSPSDLTPELLAELEQLSLQGQLSNLVTPWQPWWTTPAAAELRLNATGQRVIAVVVEHEQQAAANRAQPEATAQGEAQQGVSALPEPPAEALPTLAVLAGHNFKASPLLRWQLLQLVVAYCAVMRLFNGEPDSIEGWETAEQLLQFAPPLAQLMLTPAGQQQQTVKQQQQQQQSMASNLQAWQSAPPESLRSACVQLTAAAAGAIARGPNSEKTTLQVAMADALTLLQLGRSAVLLALIDSQRIVEDSAQVMKQHTRQQLCSGARAHSKAGSAATNDSQATQQLKQLRHHLKLAARKLLFFCVWCNEQPADMFQALAAHLQAELQEQQEVSGTAAIYQTSSFSPPVVAAGQAVRQKSAMSWQPVADSLPSVHAVDLQTQQRPTIVAASAAQQSAADRQGDQQRAEGLEPVVLASHHRHIGVAKQSSQSASRVQVPEAVGLSPGLPPVGHDNTSSTASGGENASASSLYDLD